jgi:thiamine biosynthesis protein ThiS
MTIWLHDREVEVEEKKFVKDLLEDLKLIPATVLVLKNKQIVEPKERIRAEDSIEIIKVMSGG